MIISYPLQFSDNSIIILIKHQVRLQFLQTWIYLAMSLLVGPEKVTFNHILIFFTIFALD